MAKGGDDLRSLVIGDDGQIHNREFALVMLQLVKEQLDVSPVVYESEDGSQYFNSSSPPKVRCMIILTMGHH